MESKELKERIETIYFVANMAFLGYKRYQVILSDTALFSSVFPGVNPENPKINHVLDDQNVIFTTSKKEILEDRNYNLYKAWQIAYCIIGMSSMFELYLSAVITKVTSIEFEGMGAFTRFRKLTGIEISDLKDFKALKEFHEIRNITIHNLAKESERFLKKTESENEKDIPHVFSPINMQEYKDLILKMVDHIESKLEVS